MQLPVTRQAVVLAPVMRWMLPGAKNSAIGTVPCDHADEPVGVVLVAVQGGKQLGHLRCGWFERGSLAGQLVHRRGRLVPLPLVAGQRAGERLAACEAGVDGLGQELRVAERVADALGGQRSPG